MAGAMSLSPAKGRALLKITEENMGGDPWQATAWTDYSSSVASKPREEIFSDKMVTHEDPRKSFDPGAIALRESRDSDNHPRSTPVIVALDVTGTMGDIPDLLVRDGLGTFVNETLEREPVEDPQVMFMAVGDIDVDRAPLQVTQFESDIKIAEQLGQLYLEGGGGGNHHESYTAPWYFAATRTSTDSFEKRGKKGYLVTVGDEECPDFLTRAQIKKVFGDDVPGDIPARALFDQVSQQYEVYHVVIEQGSYASRHLERVLDTWHAAIGKERVLQVSDYRKLPEVLVSAIEVHEGRNHDAVAKSWSGNTALVVADAIRHMPAVAGRPGRGARGDLVKLGYGT